MKIKKLLRLTVGTIGQGGVAALTIVAVIAPSIIPGGKSVTSAITRFSGSAISEIQKWKTKD